jgi:hypothetical protein
MPSILDPPPQSPGAPLIKSPHCPACGDRMRFTSLEPHERYTNLDVRNFACDCGSTTSDIVARECFKIS